MAVLTNLPDLDDPDLNQDLQPPPILYHYTDTKGFKGILENRVQLWATHCQFVNDSQEVTFGADIVKEVLELFRDEADGLGVQVQDLVEKTDKCSKSDCFFACFSESHEVLSQWRVYADNCSGYCLALRPEERLIGYGDEDAYHSNHLLKCLYGAKEVKEWLVARFQRKISLARSRSANPAWLSSELMRVVNRCLHRAKHEHFREEREWRLVVDRPQEDMQFRMGALGLTPYLETEPLCLDGVWVGPRTRPDDEAAIRTAQRFLAKHKLNPTVKCWASPVRR